MDRIQLHEGSEVFGCLTEKDRITSRTSIPYGLTGTKQKKALDGWLSQMIEELKLCKRFMNKINDTKDRFSPCYL